MYKKNRGIVKKNIEQCQKMGKKYRACRKTTRPPGIKNQMARPLTNLFANSAMNFSIHM